MEWKGSRGERYFEMMVENWPYKLSALVLALLLWFNVTGSDRQTSWVPTRLQVEVQDEDWVLVSSPGEVHTNFQGSRNDLLAFTRNPPVIRQVIETVTGPEMERSLRPEMVSYQRGLNVRPIGVRPSSITVALERREERRVPVESRLELSGGPGFTVLRPPILQPESVTVSGAASEVRTLNSVPTEPVALEDLRRSVTRELQLQIPDGLDRVEVTPSSILATVEVDTLLERTIRKPLLVRGGTAGAVSVDTDSVTVNLRGAESLIQRLGLDEVTAYVDVEEAPDDEGSLPVHVEVPDGRQITTSTDPTEVRVLRRGGR